MDRPSQQAANVFWKTKDYRFGPSAGPQLYTFLECFTYSNSKPTFTEDEHLGLEILRRLHTAPPDNDAQRPISSLQIIRVDRDAHDKLRANFLIFRQILSVLNIHPQILAFVVQGGYGTETLRCVRKDGYIDSFYFNSVSGMTIWTWDSRTQATKAVFIPAISDGIHGSKAIWKSLVTRLEAHVDLINYPGLLRVIGSIELADYLDLVYTSFRKHFTRTLGSDSSSPGNPARDQSTLMKNCEAINSVVSKLRSALRQNDVLLDILAAETQGYCDMAETSIDLLCKQARSRKEDLQFLYEQAKQQLLLISNVIDAQKSAIIARQVLFMKIVSSAIILFCLLAAGFLIATTSMLWKSNHVRDVSLISQFLWAVIAMIHIAAVSFYVGVRGKVAADPTVASLYKTVWGKFFKR